MSRLAAELRRSWTWRSMLLLAWVPAAYAAELGPLVAGLDYRPTRIGTMDLGDMAGAFDPTNPLAMFDYRSNSHGDFPNTAIPGLYGVDFYGNLSFQVSGSNVHIHIDGIQNPSATYTTGSLLLELWALKTAYSPGGGSGYKTAAVRTNQIPGLKDALAPNERFYNIDVYPAYTPPGDSSYASFTLFLKMYDSNPATCTSSDHYCIIAYVNFPSSSPPPPPPPPPPPGPPPPSPPPPPPPVGNCTPNASTACLQGGRFEVKVTWKYYDGSTGPANVMLFNGQRAGNDESSFWTFQTASNYEMGIKVLSRCAHGWGDTYQIMISALTDQGWSAAIRDTVTGATFPYTNVPGVLPAVLNQDHVESCR